MTHEQHTSPASDPFWTADTPLDAEVPLRGGPAEVRVKVHVSEESYPRGHSTTEIVPLSEEAGTRMYILAHSYIQVPDVTLGIGLYRRPSASGAVGEVVSVTERGKHAVPIGSAQAWYYPADRTIVFWELLLHAPFREASLPPGKDAAYLALWRGLENELCTRFPDAMRIVTPSWDPDYDHEAWQQFLSTLGYAPATPLAFAKSLANSLDAEAAGSGHG